MLMTPVLETNKHVFTVDGSSDERLLLTMYSAEPLIIKNKINR